MSIIANQNFVSKLKEPFLALRNKIFATLYLAETISLLGDAFTWVGLALLSYQFGRERSAMILSSALTLRVTAFILFSPFAGTVADKIEKKKILYTTHFARMAIVSCLPFVSAEWQVYSLIFLLNVFNAFFTPTYRSVIPHIIEKDYYRQAVGLSTATFQFLGVLGPALAGILAVWLGAREIFFVDAASFVIAAILILMLPSISLQSPVRKKEQRASAWGEVISGIKLLFSDKFIRFALAIEFVSAIAGAQILVNTIGYIKSTLQLTDKYYGLVMSAFAVGAAISAFVGGSVDKSPSRKFSLVVGGLLIGISISFANYAGFIALLALWVFAGLGQSLAEMPSETLIGERINETEQGKVYGSHFAFSHLWWAIAYPVAGYIGANFNNRNFLYGGLLTLGCLFIVYLFFRPEGRKR
jgi:NRE family putative nickel resistance protein-like MFS transporter